MRKFFLILLILNSSIASVLFSEENREIAKETLEQIEDLEKSIEMLKKWQSQYLKKKNNYESHRKRILFRNNSPKDAQKADLLAKEAYENAQEIQAQIDVLQERKNGLKESLP